MLCKSICYFLLLLKSKSHSCLSVLSLLLLYFLFHDLFISSFSFFLGVNFRLFRFIFRLYFWVCFGVLGFDRFVTLFLLFFKFSLFCLCYVVDVGLFGKDFLSFVFTVFLDFLCKVFRNDDTLFLLGWVVAGFVLWFRGRDLIRIQGLYC